MVESFDLAIIDGKVVTGQEVIPATLVVRGGKIAGILDPTEKPQAAEQVSADGLHILPGIIDTHVHLRDPGCPEREDFASGTSAAAAGGITTILEMPISEPPVNSGQVLSQRIREVQSRALVDYAMYGAVGQENPDQVVPQVEAGAVAFKTFLHAPMPGRENEFFGLFCTDEGALREIVQETAQTGLLHCFHSENNTMLEHIEKRLHEVGRKDGMAHAESRPTVAEDAAVAELLAIAEDARARVQIVHMSSPRAVQLVKEAKARGVRVTAETCPHYLFLTDEALKEHGPYAKCNPPLRNRATVEQLWSYLRDGAIDVIGSDHAPFLDSEKQKGLHDIFGAPAGFPGLEPMLPLMLDAVNKGLLSLTELARLMSERAAALFRLPSKGRIAPGADADLTLVDMQREWTFDRNLSFSKAKDTMRVYDGMKISGQVVTTFSRGERVYQDGEITAKPGRGKFVRPASEKE